MKRALIIAMIAGLAATGCNPALSATSTANLAVQMTLNASCTFYAATIVIFGSQSALGANVDANSAIAINCPRGTAFTIGLDKGQGAGATYAARKMTSGANTVTYSLYLDSARTKVWGETDGVDTFSGTSASFGATCPVYGRVPAQASPAPGNYTDTVKITVTY
jgi:spore coat protein U-like protein